MSAVVLRSKGIQITGLLQRIPNLDAAVSLLMMLL
jgi:hypothetical protein